MDLSLRSAHPNCPGSTPVIAVRTMMMTIGKMAMMIDRKANHYKDPFTKQRHRNKQTHACLHGCTNTLYRQVIFKKSLSFDIPKIVLARADCAEGAVGQGEDHGWQDCAKPLPRWPDAPPLPRQPCRLPRAVFLRFVYPNLKQLSSAINCRPPRILI